MDANFWHQKWKENNIAFHKSETNPLLAAYFNKLSLPHGSRVFVPLCGKTRDIAWLLSNEYQVAGVELNEKAVEQLFIDLGKQPNISSAGKFNCYSTGNIDIFVGDIFDLSATILGPIHAIYDRAALVALPEKMRIQYTEHLTHITDKAPQLLICYEYNQSLMEGPPFSISREEINKHYDSIYTLDRLASIKVPGGLKGLDTAKENVWLLRNI